MKKKKIKKLIFGNLGFLIGFVVLFSPGLLGLSFVDASAVKAALSLTLGIMMPAGMVAYNYKTISQKNDVKLIGTNQYSVEGIRQEMKHYLGSGVFGQVARASLDELDKCEKMQAGVDEVLDRKFEKGSLTYQKFDSIAIEAPDWYSGYNNTVFDYYMFSHFMHSTMESASTAMTSQPSSSSGGGFSGGGSGGGGGGSW